ncbi:MAG: hypothetical protein IPI60_21155 [Saprospiraceae bacterium]|nr:hypothetical protein [Saprospiraceae bacterium]
MDAESLYSDREKASGNVSKGIQFVCLGGMDYREIGGLPGTMRILLNGMYFRLVRN